MSYLRNGSDITTRSYRRVRSSRLRDPTESEQVVTTESSYTRKSYDPIGSTIERQTKTVETKSSAIGSSGSMLKNSSSSSSLVQSMMGNFERVSMNDNKPTTTAKVSDDEHQQQKGEGGEETKKSSSSYTAASRRRNIQREKRMLRQKRRSTGVVSLKDLKDGKDSANNESGKDDEELKRETELNTQQNEFTKKATSALAVCGTANNNNDCGGGGGGGGEYDAKLRPSSVRSSVENLNSSGGLVKPTSALRRRANEQNNEQQDTISDLKEQLFLAQAKVNRLTNTIKTMDEEQRKLEDENRRLKRNNKLLEDENNTMLRLIRAREFE